jgi:NAD(P)-dependent dehydrogenase (short-subunit alcohol dehydrogenase family)
MSQLTDRVVVITGGASGLGRAVALASAEVGANVGILDLPSKRLDSTYGELVGRTPDCLALGVDLTKEAEITAAFEQTLARWGQVHTVVNSAGVYYYGPLTTTPVEQFDRVYDVNVRGLFLVCREAARAMLPRGSGHIINIASIAAQHGVIGESAYSSSKWAVRGLGHTLALELGPSGIRVTTVFPGGMDTPFWETDARKLAGEFDTSRFLRPEHVAQAIVQLASLPPQIVVKEVLVYPPGR